MKSGLKFRTWLAGAAILAAGQLSSVQAAELKIAYVDIKSALENTAEYKQGMKRLHALNDKKVKELKALKEKINKAEKELMSPSLMSQEHLSKKQQRLKDLTKEFQRKQQDAQEELSAEKNRIDIATMNKFQKVIVAYGKEKHYDFILPKPVSLYANPALDITGEITKLLDAKK